MKPVVTIADLDRMELSPNGEEHPVFGASVASLTGIDATFGLGAMHVRVKPGKRAFPRHNHLAQTEMFVILEGEGTYRLGEEEHPVKAGDVCFARNGGAETAHQLVNTGTSDLAYIAISTMNDPDIVEYPDSGKFQAISVWPGTNFFTSYLRYIGKTEDAHDYWEGEA